MFTNEMLETVLTAAAAGALLAPLVALMERTHRRMSADQGGRIGWFTDGRDADARRINDELRARSGEEGTGSSAGHPGPRRASTRLHHRHGVRHA
ncbi:hypothetical protein ACK8HX_15820 [Oryzobacter sp. R7]|uniref:hypothetical protein n=1 Tax=Oryzobacter faecalis TaxID=3388656 RepID=UPI00398D20F0